MNSLKNKKVRSENTGFTGFRSGVSPGRVRSRFHVNSEVSIDSLYGSSVRGMCMCPCLSGGRGLEQTGSAVRGDLHYLACYLHRPLDLCQTLKRDLLHSKYYLDSRIALHCSQSRKFSLIVFWNLVQPLMFTLVSAAPFCF